MSWQFGSVLVLLGALMAGFAWYERSRPDSRVVALVATLAAVAALGRIAFAALPNVKPTTDIVLIAGLALGGAPGFVVGAVAGMTSNFFFGQGPWTPWQMAAWGLVGLIGALLARFWPRRSGGELAIGRWPLAIVCALCGYAFAAAQDFGDWVNFSDHSLGQLGVRMAAGTGFDVIHAAGCLAFALAFGPWLARSIARFSARLNVVWKPAGVPLAGVLALALGTAAGAVAVGGAAPASAASGPEAYLLGAQRSDGGFGPSPGAPSASLYSGWAALGLAAAGHNPAEVSHGGASLLDYLRLDRSALADPGSIERTLLVAGAAGVPVSSFGGHDLAAALRAQMRTDGSVADQVNLTTFAVLALRAGGLKPSERTLSWLARQQDRDGGFGFATAGGASDIDDTGAVLEAIGHRPPTSERAVHFLRANQNPDGGLPTQPGYGSNAQSTAWAIQGLLAAGAAPETLHHGGASPIDYLHSLTAPDGHVRYSQTSDQTPVWVTAEALMALDRQPLPLAPVASASSSPPSAPAGVSARPRASSSRHSADAAAPGRHRRSPAPGGADGALSRLAADAAVLAALAFSPVGG